MKAAVYRRFGGPDVIQIETRASPEPRPTEVLIRVHASTVSAADYRARSKDVPSGLALPSSLVLGFVKPRRPVLGMDCAGVVEAVGGRVSRFAPGDEVIGMLGSAFGGHAEFVVADEHSPIALKPATATFSEAVSLVFGGITARAFLNQAPLKRGSRVLVNGASGAVGSAAVQLAKAAGAHVTAVCSAANASLVTGLGADRVLDYATTDFASGGFAGGDVTDVGYAADTSRYDIAIDCVGNAPVSRVHSIVEPGGAVLLVSGNLRSLVTASRESKRHGFTVVATPGRYLAGDLDYLVDLFDAGQLRPVIDSTYPFADIVSAHRRVDSHRKRGAVVVDLGQPEQPPIDKSIAEARGAAESSH
ncbi:MAG: NAD(P)-dependent alcohol dehydrogenase [Rhodoglobus sp.]